MKSALEASSGMTLCVLRSTWPSFPLARSRRELPTGNLQSRVMCAEVLSPEGAFRAGSAWRSQQALARVRLKVLALRVWGSAPAPPPKKPTSVVFKPGFRAGRGDSTCPGRSREPLPERGICVTAVRTLRLAHQTSCESVLLHERRNGQFRLQVAGHPKYASPGDRTAWSRFFS